MRRRRDPEKSYNFLHAIFRKKYLPDRRKLYFVILDDDEVFRAYDSLYLPLMYHVLEALVKRRPRLPIDLGDGASLYAISHSLHEAVYISREMNKKLFS